MLSAQDIKEYRSQFEQQLAQVKDFAGLETLRVSFLGKKGCIKNATTLLADADIETKKTLGGLLHPLKKDIETAINEKLLFLQEKEQELKLATEKIDVTLPGTPVSGGSIHPITKMIHRTFEIFRSIGFDCEFGPEIELEHYNFDALNIPPHHPARTQADTFFVNQKLQQVLRTHTSGVQIRTMNKQAPPIAIVSPGMCFRKDEIDATHLPLFHQIEGLFVSKNVSFADLKGVLTYFAQSLFGSDTKVRFRPDFFPFTEPSAEVSFSCPACKGHATGCRTCRESGYIEVAGCGITHPNVIKNGGLDPRIYSGYAFGFGIERLAMIYFGISDIRTLYSYNKENLAQFSNPWF